jgi:glycosyltransferase involved in cell wall biosynthesis
MWQMTLPPRLAALGNIIESKVAPPIYHRTPVVTLSESSKRELVHDLGFRADRVSVVPPGIDPHYSPGGPKSPTPLVVAVGRLVPVKQFDVLVDALVALKPGHPDLEAVIVGEGYRREELEAQIHAARAEGWIKLPGRVEEDEKVDLYRRAWLLASASAREGWGMTITEAAACRTPAVVSNVAGHADAVIDGTTGILADGGDALRDGLDRLLRDDAARDAMSAAARDHASRYTWEATARGTLQVLADAAIARRGRPGPP